MDQTTLQTLRILHLEDSLYDRELIQGLLKTEGFECEICDAHNREEFIAAIENHDFDLILADRSLPGFDGVSALRIAKEKKPDVPFVFVSGSMGEEAAIETIKNGATDYVLKNRLSRLLPAVKRAITEAQERQRTKQFIEALAERERQLREQAALLDEAREAIFVCDLNLRITFWNRGAERMYGYSRNETVGRTLAELLHNNDHGTREEARLQTLEKGEWLGELNRVTKDGKKITVQAHWSLVKDESNRPKSFLIINADITEKKQLEMQFLRAQRMESIGILAGGIAHDLNNVLAPILMVSQLLRMKTEDPESLQWLDSLESSARHGADLIKQILAFSRGMEGERVEMQIGHLVRDIQKILRETFPRSIEIKTEVPKDLWVIKGVATHLNQVLMNLCVNARDAMPNGGQIRIVAENVEVDEGYSQLHPDAKPGPYVVVSVVDNGTGIPSEVMEQIYDPFFTTKEIGKGTGLGLSTVKGIVKSHGGFIHVYSELGRGTAFKIYLPALVTATMETVEQRRVHLPRGHGETVLVVDDETPVRDTIKSMLERFNYRVMTAGDGVEGLALYVQNRHEIKLVLTDIMMPLMEGRALIRALRKIEPTSRIIALSGLMEAAQLESAPDVGEVALVSKPFTAEHLLTAVHRALANP